MNIDLTAILYLAYAAAIGIAFAIIYTNIQRSAYSVFINALMTQEAFTKENAKNLNDLGIKGINKLVIKSSVKNKHSLGKYVSQYSNNACNDALESFLAGSNKDFKYFIHDDDHTAIIEKYKYTPIKTIHLIAYLIALFIAMIVFTIGTKMFFDNHITPQLQSEQQKNAEEQISDFEDSQGSGKTNNDYDDSSVAVIPTLN